MLFKTESPEWTRRGEGTGLYVRVWGLQVCAEAGDAVVSLFSYIGP